MFQLLFGLDLFYVIKGYNIKCIIKNNERDYGWEVV